MTERILVADDTRANRLVAVGHLEAAGYAVEAVGSGEEALDRLAREMFDLIVLDIRMPGIGGFETCRRIRATPATRDVPVLFLTAFGVTEPALEAGGDDLLPKPFHHAELLLRVRALIRQRKQAQKLEAKNGQLREISQLIVHDLRGSMSSILANAEVLNEAPIAPELRPNVDDIIVGVTQMDRTVTDLLELTRAEDVGIKPQLEKLDARALAEEVIAGLRGYARASDVQVETAVAIETMIADRELIRRMLQNLLHNAIRHSPRHSIVIIDAMRRGDCVVWKVLDRGRGVAPEDRERIFDRYVSQHRSGLGLRMCRLAAEAHGGRIWVEPREPVGSMFCVEIPQPAAVIGGTA